MGRRATKFVASLTADERKRLRELWQGDANARVRQRAHALLLSDQGHTVTELAAIFAVHRKTIVAWLERWANDRSDGLADEDRPGRRPKLTAAQRDEALKILDQFSHSPQQALAAIEKRFGVRLSRSALRRMARAGNRRWKRMRRTHHDRRDEAVFREAQRDVADVIQASTAAGMDVYFFDQAGFSMVPSIPYGWQVIGTRTEIPSQHSPRINVLGFFSTQQQFHSFTVEGRVDSACVVTCMDQFSLKLARETVLFLDNASLHTSHLFRSKQPLWEERGLHLCFLPPYCSELNLIERLWRMMKYHWLPLDAFQSRPLFRQRLEEVLVGIGTTYLMNLPY